MRVWGRRSGGEGWEGGFGDLGVTVRMSCNVF